jgi:hypothetical protein
MEPTEVIGDRVVVKVSRKDPRDAARHIRQCAKHKKTARRQPKYRKNFDPTLGYPGEGPPKPLQRERTGYHCPFGLTCTIKTHAHKKQREAKDGAARRHAEKRENRKHGQDVWEPCPTPDGECKNCHGHCGHTIPPAVLEYEVYGACCVDREGYISLQQDAPEDQLPQPETSAEREARYWELEEEQNASIRDQLNLDQMMCELPSENWELDGYVDETPLDATDSDEESQVVHSPTTPPPAEVVETVAVKSPVSVRCAVDTTSVPATVSTSDTTVTITPIVRAAIKVRTNQTPTPPAISPPSVHYASVETTNDTPTNLRPRATVPGAPLVAAECHLADGPRNEVMKDNPPPEEVTPGDVFKHAEKLLGSERYNDLLQTEEVIIYLRGTESQDCCNCCYQCFSCLPCTFTEREYIANKPNKHRLTEWSKSIPGISERIRFCQGCFAQRFRPPTVITNDTRDRKWWEFWRKRGADVDVDYLHAAGFTQRDTVLIYPEMLRLLMLQPEYANRQALDREAKTFQGYTTALGAAVMRIKVSGLPSKGPAELWMSNHDVYNNTIMAAVNQGILRDMRRTLAVTDTPARPDFRKRGRFPLWSRGATRFV